MNLMPRDEILFGVAEVPSVYINKKHELDYKIYVQEQVSIEQRAQIAEYEMRAKSERRTRFKKIIDSLLYQLNLVTSRVKRFSDIFGSSSKLSEKILSCNSG